MGTGQLPQKVSMTFEKGGCARKVPEATLNSAIDGSRLKGSQSLDCAEFALEAPSGFTIDTIFPLSPDLYHYARMALIHATSDLNAHGFIATHLCASLAIPPCQLSEVTAVLDGIADQCKANTIVFAKGHTVEASELSLTISAVGRQLSKTVPTTHGTDLAVIMTKPLGAARLYRLACVDDNTLGCAAGLRLLLRGHQDALHCIAGPLHGGTDVSGFGLKSSLQQLAAQYSVDISCDVGTILRCDSEYEAVPTPCEYLLNHASADESLASGRTMQTVLTLYGAEVCGPIVWLIDRNQSQLTIDALHERGFEPAVIGTAAYSPNPGVSLG